MQQRRRANAQPCPVLENRIQLITAALLNEPDIQEVKQSLSNHRGLELDAAGPPSVKPHIYRSKLVSGSSGNFGVIYWIFHEFNYHFRDVLSAFQSLLLSQNLDFLLSESRIISLLASGSLSFFVLLLQ